MLVGLRSWLVGIHNPIFHTFFVTLAWVKLFGKSPTFKEFVCIILHDLGYIFQDVIDGEDDRHPLIGAQICGALFGDDYYNLCISHSRDWARKNGLKLSKLGYADKYCVLFIPDMILKFILCSGGETKDFNRFNDKWSYESELIKVKRLYRNWWSREGTSIKKKGI